MDEERKEYLKEYYKKNKDKLNEKHKKYREQNREKINEKSRKQYKQYYQRNREKRIEYSREYFQQNKDICNEKSSEYNRNRNNTSRISANNHRQLWDPSQEEILIKLYKRNTPHEEIATRLSRTIEVIRFRIKHLKKLGKL